MKKVVAVIQARLGSTRLPYKMMLSLHGKPIIEWVVTRVLRSKRVDDVIVAIPVTQENDILAQYVERLGVKVYRGSEGDVLKRFHDAARFVDATEVVRVCADNPLIDPDEIDNLIEFFQNEDCDYAYNHIPKNNKYPDGLGAEIVSMDTLTFMERNAKEQHFREHCFSYVAEDSTQFNIRTFNPSDKMIARPDLRFDIDTFDDYYYLSRNFFDIDITSKKLVKLFMEHKQ